jgi:hypothetical protein
VLNLVRKGAEEGQQEEKKERKIEKDWKGRKRKEES